MCCAATHLDNRALYTRARPFHSARDMTAASSSALLPWADVFTFNGEAEMLRYRLALHSSFVTASVIIESNVTFTGRQKRPSQLASRILTDAERRRWNVDVAQVPLSEEIRTSLNPWKKEFAARRFATSVIAQRFPRHRVYHSDVDELLDPAAMHSLEVTTCIAPRLRFYYYSEHCPVYNETWAGAIIVNTATKWFVDRARGTPPVMMRAHPGTDLSHARKACAISDRLLGWHMSFAMASDAILQKLRSYSHAHYAGAVTRQANPSAFIDAKVRACADILGRLDVGPIDGAYDGRLPPLPGWPTHPSAPRDDAMKAARMRAF